MAFIVEDETGTLDSNSFIDTTYLDTYCSDRGIDISALTLEIKQQLLIKATSFIDSTYYGYFIGETLEETQSLVFPRVVEDETIYPDKLKQATCELALKANDGALLEDETQKVVKEKVSSIEVEYSEYSDQRKQYAFVYNLLRPYMIGSQNTKKLVRV